jgi:hypothetical protein
MAPALAPANDDRRTVGERKRCRSVNRSIMALTFASMGLRRLLARTFISSRRNPLRRPMLAPKPVLTLAR